jgi:hypothetical protein
MPLYPLGISRCRDVPTVPKQAAGSIDMRWSVVGDLACAFIDAPNDAIPPTLHAAALDVIHRRICVLPVRFGVVLHDEAEIRTMLQDRRNELLDHLTRLDRTCEMGLRIAPEDRRGKAKGGRRNGDNEPISTDKAAGSPFPRPPSPFPLSSQSPLAYIEERRTHYRRIDKAVERDCLIVQQFAERLQGYYRQWRKLQASPSYPIRLAFLVERDRVAAFQSRVESTCDTDREGRCTILGPWPPYSFV